MYGGTAKSECRNVGGKLPNSGSAGRQPGAVGGFYFSPRFGLFFVAGLKSIVDRAVCSPFSRGLSCFLFFCLSCTHRLLFLPLMLMAALRRV